MKIGYSQQIITPSLDRPVFLAGFGRNRRAQTVHDDLYARALALSEGPNTLVLCALDLIGFFRSDVMDVADRVSEYAPGTQIIIASTHTHHGPDTLGLWGPDDKTCGVDRDYMVSIKEKIFQAILSSLENMQPANVKFTSVQLPGLAKNARDPTILDNELTLAQFTHSENDLPLVTVFNFPCHPEVLSSQNTHITADYPGVLRCEVEAATGAPCIFFPGALGGMMTPNVIDHSFVEAGTMGKKLAEEGLRRLESTINTVEAGFMKQTSRIQVKLTNPLFKLAIRRGLLPDLCDRQGFVNSEVNLLKIGKLWLATIPGELLPKLGLAIKTEMQAAGAQVTGILGLANDELGYILPKESFRYPLNPFRPGKHYEETMSLSKMIGPAVVETVRDLLKSQS
jgi:hypothetical protein